MQFKIRHALKFETTRPQTFTVTVNFSCSFEKGIRPKYLDYYLEVLLSNNDHEIPTLIARRDFDSSVGPINQFTTQVSILHCCAWFERCSEIWMRSCPMGSSSRTPAMFWWRT